MLSQLYRFDQWSIEKAEKFSKKIQIWTGKNNFFLAKFMAKLAHAPFLAVLFYNPNQAPLAASLFTFGCFNLFFYIFFTKEVINYNEDRILSQAKKGVSNELKVKESAIIVRLSKIFLLFFSLAFDLLLSSTAPPVMPIFWLLLWISLVFLACDSLPPSESKLKQKIKELKASLAPAQPATNAAFHSLK
ncbi:hypothetical protein IPM19_01500 [bacterium]|nr:MAG: hypothetical protein IPM19_01500 [bacterium]